MNTKQVLIMGRHHNNPERTREVVCISGTQETLKLAHSNNIVEWIDSAVQLSAEPTGVKSFDAIAENDYIGTGNVVGAVQFSCCVRPRRQTHCNGFERPEGVLQEFDLKGLRDYRLNVVANRIKASKDFEETGGHWYLFRRRNGVESIIYGALVTNMEHDIVFRFDREHLGLPRTSAGQKILDAMELRVTSKAWSQRTRIYQRQAA